MYIARALPADLDALSPFQFGFLLPIFPSRRIRRESAEKVGFDLGDAAKIMAASSVRLQ